MRRSRWRDPCFTCNSRKSAVHSSVVHSSVVHSSAVHSSVVHSSVVHSSVPASLLHGLVRVRARRRTCRTAGGAAPGWCVAASGTSPPPSVPRLRPAPRRRPGRSEHPPSASPRSAARAGVPGMSRVGLPGRMASPDGRVNPPCSRRAGPGATPKRDPSRRSVSRIPAPETDRLQAARGGVRDRARVFAGRVRRCPEVAVGPILPPSMPLVGRTPRTGVPFHLRY